MEHTVKNCENVAKTVVSHWSQSDMVAICENYVFEQLNDCEDYFHIVVGNLEREKKKKDWGLLQKDKI